MFIFYALLLYVCFLFLCCVKFLSGCFRQFFFIWETKNGSLVALDRWSPCTLMTLWGFAWADSTLVFLEEWSSYRGGCLNRLDCGLILC